MGLSMATSAAFAFFVCFLISIATFHVCFCNGISSSANHTHNNITCFENEREALVKFKQDLKDPSNRLSSWDIEEDCCQWAGVVCDNFTGHVREIQLQSPYYRDSYSITFAEYEAYMSHKLRGKVNPSLLDLKHLQYLDLSNNYFEGTSIPSFIGSIANLRYLNLSDARFRGAIPPQLGNLTKIHYMGLRGGFDDHNELVLHSDGNLHWLSGLVSLQHLDMSGIDLSKALDWLQVSAKRTNVPGMKQYRGRRPNPYFGFPSRRPSLHARSAFLYFIWIWKGSKVQAANAVQAVLFVDRAFVGLSMHSPVFLISSFMNQQLQS